MPFQFMDKDNVVGTKADFINAVEYRRNVLIDSLMEWGIACGDHGWPGPQPIEEALSWAIQHHMGQDDGVPFSIAEFPTHFHHAATLYAKVLDSLAEYDAARDACWQAGIDFLSELGLG